MFAITWIAVKVISFGGDRHVLCNIQFYPGTSGRLHAEQQPLLRCLPGYIQKIPLK